MIISHYNGVEHFIPEPAASPPVQRHLFPFSFLPPSGLTGQFVGPLMNFGLKQEGFMAPGLQPRPAHGRYPFCCCGTSTLNCRLFRHFQGPKLSTAPIPVKVSPLCCLGKQVISGSGVTPCVFVGFVSAVLLLWK